MRVQRYATAEGWPGVRWEQEVASGETLASRGRDKQWRAAAIVAAAAFVLVALAGGGVIWAALLGLVLGGMVAAPLPFENVRVRPYGAAVVGPLRQTEAEKNQASLRKATPLYGVERRSAEVTLGGKRELRFVLKDENARKELLNVELLDFDAFEVGTFEEWFGDVAERKVADIRGTPGEWVILAVTRSAGVQQIARSGRGKAGMALLHQALLDEFVAPRREMLKRVDTAM